MKKVYNEPLVEVMAVTMQNELLVGSPKPGPRPPMPRFEGDVIE